MFGFIKCLWPNATPQSTAALQGQASNATPGQEQATVDMRQRGGVASTPTPIQDIVDEMIGDDSGYFTNSPHDSWDEKDKTSPCSSGHGVTSQSPASETRYSGTSYRPVQNRNLLEPASSTQFTSPSPVFAQSEEDHETLMNSEPRSTYLQSQSAKKEVDEFRSYNNESGMSSLSPKQIDKNQVSLPRSVLNQH
jgi:hypothetical protein